MSLIEPSNDSLTSSPDSPAGTVPLVRRRDLREASTRKSRRAAVKRAEALRKAAPPRQPAASGPRRNRAERARKPLGQRIAAKAFAVVALLSAVLFAAASSIPASAFQTPSTTAAQSAGPSAKTEVSSTIDGQSLEVAGGETTDVARDSFSAVSLKEVPLFNYSRDLSYTVNNSGKIRWPFPVAVPLGDLFGPRVAPCAGCSTFHHGTDFQPGDGAPVYAVADGVVTVSEFSGSLGQHVAIEHTIDGKTFTSIYGHMQAGSSKLKVGQKVKKSDIVGLVGSTGESTGPHLDFEIDIDGTPVDSFVWLKANTAH